LKISHSWLLLAACLACVAGCANPPPLPAPNRSYVTLLSSPDGSVGKIVVQGAKGVQRIEQANYAAPLDGSAPAAQVDEAQVQRDFGEAMAARPELPQHFVLYFESGGAQLTPESQAQLSQIVDSAARRATVDMSVIGHSDTVGKVELNEALSLKRAQTVAELIQAKGLKVDALTIASHGKRNLLVATPDETPEPRNRRVEISIR
jgi:outer membrane protein OmpA-like peptidoglycan-associated protein